MTRDEIKDLKGRDLDRAVALLFPDWKERWLTNHNFANGPSTIFQPPPFSDSIAAAFEVVEHMVAQGWMFGCEVMSADRRSRYRARFHRTGVSERAVTTSMPGAICRAALIAHFANGLE